MIDRIVKDFTLYRRPRRRAGPVAHLARVRETLGGVDILVNNAGILGGLSVLEMPLDLWEAQNAALRLWREGSQPDRDVLAPLMAALGFAPPALLTPRERK